jgi:pilus assembly protein CpaE
MGCLRNDLTISKDRILVVVNRYDKDGSITLDDIRNTLNCHELALVPNDFRTVSQCIDSGTPLLELARSAAITRALMTLETRLGGEAAAQRRGLFARAFSNFSKTRSP